MSIAGKEVATYREDEVGEPHFQQRHGRIWEEHVKAHEYAELDAESAREG